MNGSLIAISLTEKELKIADIVTESRESLVRELYSYDIEDLDDIALTGLIKEAVKKYPRKTYRSLLIINSNDLEYRDFSFPFSSYYKVKKAIQYEISSEYPSENYLIDHITKFSADSANSSFLCAIAGHAVVQRQVGIINNAGLQVAGITSDTSILGQFFYSEDNCMIMEINKQNTILIFLVHGIPAMIRNIPLGIDKIGLNGIGLEEISTNKAKIDEIGIKEIGAKKAGQTRKHALQRLTGEIKKTLFTYKTRTGAEPSCLFMAGEIAGRDALIDILATDILTGNNRLNIKDLPASGKTIRLMKNSYPVSRYASIAGAAVWEKNNKQSFDFSRSGGITKAGRSIKSRVSPLVAAVLVFAGIAFLSSLWLDVYSLDQRKTLIKKEIRDLYLKTFPQSGRVMDELKQAKNYLKEAEANLYQGDADKTVPILDVIDKISAAVPPKTSFRILSLFCEKGKIQINGSTDSYKSVNNIKEHLDGINDFQDIEISNANMTKSGQNVEFKISFRVDG